MQLAHINIGMMRGPISSEIMSEFRQQIAHFNLLADLSPGFIWRLQSEHGDTADIDAFGDERMFITMSVWLSIEHLLDFTYHSAHAGMFRRRREWIEQGTSQIALWWVRDGRIPSIQEAKRRLASIAQYGPTPFAFDFRTRFPEASRLRRESGPGKVP